jgi:hypothetical protein
MSRKQEGIDIMKLMTFGSHKGWNEFLDKCYKNNNINELARVKYQISVGMTDLAKTNLNTEEINVQFVRWVRSLEITARKIIKKMYPMPTDSISRDELALISNDDKTKIQKAKRARDAALAEFLRKSSF